MAPPSLSNHVLYDSIFFIECLTLRENKNVEIVR